MKKRMLTGITPSGAMTLGNYLGAIKRAVEFQDEYELFVFIANLHAITIPQDPKKLRQNTHEIANLYFACGLDVKKSIVFLQSDVWQHSQLAWILNTQATIGELSRMTQFKDKSQKAEKTGNGYIPAGLFTYPTLMAADILLYDANFVPVGIDQKQHVELTRDLAIRINNKYKKVFTVPEPLITKTKTKIMDFQDPTKKMSKSSDNPKSLIYMLDPPEVIQQKIKVAITDSENLIKYNPEEKPGVSNLITIYTTLKGISIEEAEKHWEGKNYKNLKDDVAQTIIETLTPIQKKYHELIKNNTVEKWLSEGAQKAQKIAEQKIELVQNALGINYVAKNN